MDKPQPRVNEVSKPYWEGVNASRILLQRCLSDGCHQVIFYPRVCCPFCKRAEIEWIEAAGTGRVISHTTVYRTHHDGFNGDAPYVFAAIKLTEGALLYGQMPGAPTDGTSLIGRAVKAAFVPHGPSRQIVVFQLANA